jgi:hypothetical protein
MHSLFNKINVSITFILLELTWSLALLEEDGIEEQDAKVKCVST